MFATYEAQIGGWFYKLIRIGAARIQGLSFFVSVLFALGGSMQVARAADGNLDSSFNDSRKVLIAAIGPSEPPHATPTPNASEPPHATPTPHASEPPHATPTPNASEPPHATPTPHASEPPHVTPTPHPSEPPHVTPTPNASEPPHITPTPHASEPPHVTPTPHASEPPHVTPTPHASEPPHVTPTPHASEPPHATPTPHASEPPHATPTPHASEPPHATPTPHASEPPHATPTPHASEPPHATPTPHASEPPHATPTPHASEPPHATPVTTTTPHVTVQPLNFSTRLHVEAGENVAIGGFMITGNSPKRVAIRGMGPSLQSAGLSSAALPDPTLQLRGSDNALIASNDNWRDNSVWAAELEAIGLAPGFDFESAIVATLSPGAYTAIVGGNNGSAGMGLVEVYDLDPAGDAQLANISTRGLVGTGDEVVIGGFIIGGNTGQASVLLRAIGPSLTAAGITNALANPTLELRDNNGVLLQSNDNWIDSQQAAIEATGLAPQNNFEAAILATLLPGSYTAIAAGKDGSMGVGLIEVYNLPPQ